MRPTPPKTLTGKVTHFDGRFYRVECEAPEGLEYLRFHLLLPGQMRADNVAAEIGQTVELTYYSTLSMGFWHVSRIVR